MADWTQLAQDVDGETLKKPPIFILEDHSNTTMHEKEIKTWQCCPFCKKQLPDSALRKIALCTIIGEKFRKEDHSDRLAPLFQEIAKCISDHIHECLLRQQKQAEQSGGHISSILHREGSANQEEILQCWC